MNVEMWFPVSIYSEKELFSAEQNKLWTDYILNLKTTVPSAHNNWQGGTYTTHESREYYLKSDPMFAPLVEKITDRVNSFARKHGCDGIYECQHAWINVADSNNFQEFHTHNGSIFSLVYYVSAPEGSGRILFEDPKEPDMMPLKSIKHDSPLSYQRIHYKAEEGCVIIFRSYLRHMVEPGTNITPRISISMNFG